MPIRDRISPLPARPCDPAGLRGISAGFPALSPCRGQVAYALRTRAPVASGVLLPPAAPRLACVKPAASVHPEPGSNSSLYELLLINFTFDSSRVSPPGLAGGSRHTLSLNPIISTFSRFLAGLPVGYPFLSKAGAKIQPFSKPPKFFFEKNPTILLTIWITIRFFLNFFTKTEKTARKKPKNSEKKQKMKTPDLKKKYTSV